MKTKPILSCVCLPFSAPRLCVLAASLALLGSASAGLVVVDPDGFASETDISAAVPGVILSAETSYDGKVYALESTMDPGYNVFAYTEEVSGSTFFVSHWAYDTAPLFKAVFDELMSSVSLDFFTGMGSVGPMGMLAAFDAGDNLLDTVLAPIGDGFTTLTVSDPGAQIKSITATFGQGGGSDFGELRNLVAVPEPGALWGALLMAGVCAAAASRRQRP